MKELIIRLICIIRVMSVITVAVCLLFCNSNTVSKVVRNNDVFPVRIAANKLFIKAWRHGIFVSMFIRSQLQLYLGRLYLNLNLSFYSKLRIRALYVYARITPELYKYVYGLHSKLLEPNFPGMNPIMQRKLLICSETLQFGWNFNQYLAKIENSGSTPIALFCFTLLLSLVCSRKLIGIGY